MTAQKWGPAHVANAIYDFADICHAVVSMEVVSFNNISLIFFYMDPSFVSNTSYQRLKLMDVGSSSICLLQSLDKVQTIEPWAPLHSTLDMIICIIKSVPLAEIKSHFLKMTVVPARSSVESSPLVSVKQCSLGAAVVPLQSSYLKPVLSYSLGAAVTSFLQ